MNQDNFTVTIICFTLIAVGIAFSTLSLTSWAQVEKGNQLETSRGNLNKSNASAQSAFPTSALTTNIKNDTHSYINITTAIVRPGGSNTATALCDIGDPLLTGGYAIGFKNGHSVANVSIYANHPSGKMTSPKIDPATLEATRFFQEGWETGLLNNGDEDIKITAEVLCANVQK